MSVVKNFIQFIDINKYLFINEIIFKIESDMEWVQDPEDESSEEEYVNKSSFSYNLNDELIFEMEN